MHITMTNELSSAHAESIHKLHALCAAHDGTTAPLALDAGMNFDPGLPAFYLGTQDGEIIAFLMIFAPDKAEAEITAFAAPHYRRQGYFRALLGEAKAQLSVRGVERLLLLCDAASADGRAALNALGTNYEYSEYTMFRTLESVPAADTTLHITEAGPKELEELSALAAEINDDDPAFYHSMLGRAFAAPCMTVFSAWLGKQRVGLCRVIWDEQPPSICTLGIRPDLRGRGLGKALLLLAMGEIATRGHGSVALDVDSGNTSALSLYRKAGFQVKAQVDYYASSQACSD